MIRLEKEEKQKSVDKADLFVRRVKFLVFVESIKTFFINISNFLVNFFQ